MGNSILAFLPIEFPPRIVRLFVTGFLPSSCAVPESGDSVCRRKRLTPKARRGGEQLAGGLELAITLNKR